MTVYLDIGAVHIQSYLARTSQLRGRRGASAALSEATTTEKVAKEVAASTGVPVMPNTQSGDADGKISLMLEVETDIQQAVTSVAAAVFTHLRGRLPGAEFKASWGQGDDYVSAVEEMKDTPKRTVESHAPVDEFPLTAPCQVCRYDPAIDVIERKTLGGKPTRVCADCRMRYDEDTYEIGGEREKKLAKTLAAERTVNGKKVERLKPPQSFEDLAKLDDASAKRNHLATIYADGNAIGALFRDLPNEGDQATRELRKHMSQALVQTTINALEEATRAIVRSPDDGEMLCAVPHVVGGDDILVTVPAGRGWRFAREFLKAFGSGVPVPEKTTAPTASAGIVFHHQTYPFNLVVDEAEEGLRAAKRRGARPRGNSGELPVCEPSLHFLDITTDGPGASTRPAFRLADIEGSAAYLDVLSGVPAAHRARLIDILTRKRASHPDEDTPQRRLGDARATARRVGHDDAIAPFMDDGESAIELADALRIVRWWR